jgi:hypothetical protein
MLEGDRHVGDPMFGFGVDPAVALQDLLERAKNMCSTDAQIALRDSYETSFGIYRHDAPNLDDPFALIRMHWSEDTVTGSRLHERMSEYLDADIGKFFNLSFNEYIDNPTYICDFMFQEARRRISREKPVIDALQDALAAGRKGR